MDKRVVIPCTMFSCVHAYVKEKLFTGHIKNDKTDFIRATLVGKKTHYRIGLNSEYSKDSWRFIANKQSEGVSGWKITKRNSIEH